VFILFKLMFNFLSADATVFIIPPVIIYLFEGQTYFLPYTIDTIVYLH